MVVCDFGDQRVTSVGLTCVSSAAFVGITNRFVILYVDCTDCVQLLASTKFVLYMRYIIILVYFMAELTQCQQDHIAKSSTDRLHSQLVRSGMEERDVSRIERDELKAVTAKVEAWRLAKSLPDDGEEMFVPSEAMGARAQEYEVLKMKLQLRRLEMEAESRIIEVEACRADRQAEAEIRKMELEVQLER